MKILNFGSLNIDYVYAVNHFVRAGETLQAENRSIFAGGKGLNQSLALAAALEDAADITVFHAGKIGVKDGGFLKELLAAHRINTDYITETDGATGHAVIQVNKQGQNSILLYAGANFTQDTKTIDTVLDTFSAGDYLVLQNEINNLPYIMNEARKKGMSIFLNPSPCNHAIAELPLETVSCFLLNEIECADITGCTEKEPEELLAAFQAAFPQANAVLTLGEKGVLCRFGGKIYKHGIYEVPVADTTAAGDTFTGYFIAALAGQLPVTEALRQASVAAALAVSKKGAAASIPSLHEVQTAVLQLKQ